MRHRGTTRATAAAAAAVVAALAAGGCAPPWSSRTPDTVVVGVSLPLTGGLAEIGAVHRNAIELAAEQARNQDTLLGRQLRLEMSDNLSDPQQAAQDLAAMGADRGLTAVVVAGCPDCTTDLSTAVPVISLDPGPDVASPADERRWIFQLAHDPGDNADQLSQRIAADGAATVGVIAAADPYGRVGSEQIAAAAARDQLQVVAQDQVSAGTALEAGRRIGQWAPPAQPFAPPPPADGPDAVVVWTNPALAVAAITGLREAGYAGDLYLDGAAVADVTSTGDIYDQAVMVATPTPVADQIVATTPQAAQRQTWFRAYLARYGTYHVHATWAADAVTVITDAVGRAGSTDPAAVRDALESARVSGLTGLIRFTADQHHGLHPQSLVLLQAAQGRWHPAG